MEKRSINYLELKMKSLWKWLTFNQGEEKEMMNDDKLNKNELERTQQKCQQMNYGWDPTRFDPWTDTVEHYIL